MRFRRFLSAALAAAMLAGMTVISAPAASAAQLSAFRDLTDPQVAEAAEFLRLLDVVNGVPGGIYNPTGTLSRAEFCKMAVVALDRSDEESAQRGRTIYLDVGPTHWARGYINLASAITLGGEADKGGTPLVSGVGDGTFQPNRPITYGEAVTILCRVLGYSTADVSSGGAWYDGYLSTGAQVGLTEGLTLSGTDTINRGQAAILFYNLYFSKTKGSEQTYLEKQGGKSEEGGVILSTDVVADDGTEGAVKTTKGTYKTDRIFDPALEGKEGKVILDSDGKLLAFQVKEGVTDKVVNLTSAQATYLMASGGEKITVEPDTLVYKEGKATVWKDVYKDIKGSTALTFHYGANGKLSYLYFPGEATADTTTMVARTAPKSGVNPFASMASGGSYTMFKNGVLATAADIRQYDVATYDAGTRVIQVSDLKLTGVYESVSPSPAAPITIKLMGIEFSVLPTAREDLASFKVGDRITLLLTGDGKSVAGAVSASTVKSTTVGIASYDDAGTSATVELLQNGMKVSGTVSSSSKARCDNQLVTVTSGGIGKLTLTPVTGSDAKGNLDTAKGTVGDRSVAEGIVVYDRVRDGKMVEVDYDQLPATVSRSKISFVSYDYAGRVKYLVLDDVTGDAYQYGIFSYTPATQTPVYKTEKVQAKDENGDPAFDKNGDPIMIEQEVRDPVTGNLVIDHYETSSSPTLCVKQGTADGGETTTKAAPFTGSIKNGAMGGIAYTSKDRVAATVTLTPIKSVSRSAFDSEAMTVTVAGVEWPVSKDVQCYNKTTKTWFAPGEEGMEAARAYADELDLYYDRPADQGGKIRMIVVP